ncbi:MAG TPA: hypothetical protein PLG15_04225 [Candidatus Gastranaerophilaceae bacterium]|nr:hypothetical protein [Candidatus Gastranaerophilaceae bacterium]HPT41573.1 hypothetical protein [Candidatus Gastranaerophilaceae bacterium]
MKITSKNFSNNIQVSFQSRNRELRLAETVMRKVNNEFPRVSPDYLNRIFVRHNRISSAWLNAKKSLLCQYRQILAQSCNDPEVLVSYVKNAKVGNCGESAILSKMALDLNGVDRVKIFNLTEFIKNGENLTLKDVDHSIVVVNMDKSAILNDYKTFGKKAYVVDSWMGIVGYVSDVFEQYMKIFNLRNNLGVFPKSNTNSDLSELAQIFAPNLKIRKEELKFI